MTFFKKIIYSITGTILLLSFSLSAQDCTGPMQVTLSGSSSSDTIVVDLETQGITCQAEENGLINLFVSGGNGGYSFQWFDDPFSQSFRDSLTAGEYAVTITDSEGCQEVLSASIDFYTPENSELSYTSGCGECMLNNGVADYFFSTENEYIASVLDIADAEELGDTEVCLQWEAIPGECNAHPYLQRNWSVRPLTDGASCVKLFFTIDELMALVDASHDDPAPDPIDLIADNAFCLTGFSGGSENCDDFLTAKTYSQLDAEPLDIILEDMEQGIWSVSICLEEYATFYLHICDLALPINLVSFYGLIDGQKNRIFWETEEEEIHKYELQVSKNATKWRKLKTVTAQNNFNNKYTFDHQNPGQGIRYYRLKIIEYDGQYAYSDILALNRALVSREEQFLPTQFINELIFEALLPHTDVYDFVFYNEAGRIVHREKVSMKKGYQQIHFELPRLAAGAYFARIISSYDKVMTTHKIIKLRE